MMRQACPVGPTTNVMMLTGAMDTAEYIQCPLPSDYNGSLEAVLTQGSHLSRGQKAAGFWGRGIWPASRD